MHINTERSSLSGGYCVRLEGRLQGTQALYLEPPEVRQLAEWYNERNRAEKESLKAQITELQKKLDALG